MIDDLIQSKTAPLKARIAELEAEVAARDNLRTTNDILANGMWLAEARITGLEAERDQALKIERLALAQVKETTAVMEQIAAERDHLRECLDLQRDNYVSLVAERDRLKAALERLDEMTVCTSSHVYIGEGVFEDWQQISRQIIRAALSGEGVTT